MRAKLTVPAGASVVLAALLMVQIIAGWRVLRPGTGSPIVAVSAHPAPASRPSVAAIIGGHLFGTAPVAATVDASVRLALSGTLAAEDPKQGFAIIASVGGPAQVYATGTPLPGGAVLVEVYDTRALVDRGGVIEELRLPRERNSALAFTSSAGAAQAATMASAGTRERVGGAFAERSVLSVLPGNLDVVRVLRPKAVIGNGRVTGYEINAVRPERFGIQRGDQLVAVNGERFEDPEQAAKVFQKLSESTASAVDLTMVRAGESYRVTVDVTALRRLRP